MRFASWLAACAVVAAQAAETIHLKTRDLNPIRDPQEYLAAPLKRRVWGRSHYLVQFEGSVRQDSVRALQSRGAAVTGYLPHSTVLVSAADGVAFDGLNVHWVGRLESRDKISPALAATMSRPAARGAFVVEFHADVDRQEARAMLWEHNLAVFEHPDLLRNHWLVFGSTFDIARLVEWDEVAYVFPASADLILRRRVQACAGAIALPGQPGQYVKVGDGWPFDGAGGLTLDYFFAALPAKVSVPAVQSEVLRAFAEWARYANVNFEEGAAATGPRTVQVRFVTGAHGDAYPFDGPGGALAHTFYPAPPNPESIAGDIHLDAEERWQVGANIDIYSVVLHETGHALGFGHNDNPGSVMYPYYRLGVRLSADDIAGVQSLYGVREPAGAPPLNPVPEPQPPAWQPAVPAPGFPPTPAGAPPPPIPPTTPPTQPSTPPSPPPSTPPSAPPADPPSAPPTDPPPPPTSDTTPPGITITWPASTIVATSANTITFAGAAMDDVGVARVTWQNSTGTAGTAAGTRSWTAGPIPLLVGNNIVTIRAYDAAGNMAWRSVTVVRR